MNITSTEEVNKGSHLHLIMMDGRREVENKEERPSLCNNELLLIIAF
jgi:hypothetical protein